MIKIWLAILYVVFVDRTCGEFGVQKKFWKEVNTKESFTSIILNLNDI